MKPSGTELNISVYIGGCDTFERIEVTETPETVVVLAYLNDDVLDPCDSDIHVETKSVQLQLPLGSRSLLGCNPPDSVIRIPGDADIECLMTYPDTTLPPEGGMEPPHY